MRRIVIFRLHTIFCVGGFSHLSDFCPRIPAFFIGVFHEFNCFPPNLAFSIGRKQDNCLFPPTEISAIVGGKAGNEKTCLHFFEAWAYNMPNGYSRPRKPSLCRHPRPDIHPKPLSIFRPPQNLALWLFVSSDPRKNQFYSPSYLPSIA